VIVLDGRKQDVDALVFSPDGSELAVGGSASHVQLWDLARRKARPILGPRGPHRAVGFVGDGVFSVIGAGQLQVVNRASGETIEHLIAGGNYNFLHGAATADGRAIVLVGQKDYGPHLEGRALPGLTPLWSRRGQGHSIPFRVCFCPDGRMVVADDHAAHLLDPLTGEALRHVTSHPEAVPALAVSPDGLLLAVAAGVQLEVCDLATGRRRGAVRSEGRKHFTDVAFHPSGRVLAASSNHETIRVFDAASLAEVATFDWQVGPVRRVAFAPDGMRAAAAGKTGKVVVWDVDL
jgi:WD40 repeat protein